jgi:hypothetical protein
MQRQTQTIVHGPLPRLSLRTRILLGALAALWLALAGVAAWGLWSVGA